jgi:hypothetical protein
MKHRMKVQCAWCRKVRGKGGYWVVERVQTFEPCSHGICPDCEKILMDEIRERENSVPSLA